MKKESLNKRIACIGYFDSGTGKHQSNSVYGSRKSLPALSTLVDGGTQQIKVLKNMKKIKIIGDIEVGGERGRVMNRGAIREYDFNRLQRPGKGSKEVERIGQAHAVESQSGVVYKREKSIVTLIGGTHGYAIGYVVRRWKRL